MKYLLDTNICIHLLRGLYDIDKKIDDAGLDNCYISVITEMELLSGMYEARRKGRQINESALRSFLKSIQILQLDDAVELFCQQRSNLREDGIMIEDFDLMIGCTAISNGLVLVSDNVKHMKRISNIRLVNWVDR
mgnify:CR=1 FL=1